MTISSPNEVGLSSTRHGLLARAEPGPPAIDSHQKIRQLSEFQSRPFQSVGTDGSIIGYSSLLLQYTYGTEIEMSTLHDRTSGGESALRYDHQIQQDSLVGLQPLETD